MLPPDSYRLNRLLSAYQEAARATDLAADELTRQIILLEQRHREGRAILFFGIPLYRQPEIVQAREAYLRQATLEQATYDAWLHELVEYMGRIWEERVEILEKYGEFLVIERTGQSYIPVCHRNRPDGSPGDQVKFHTRHEAVFWLNNRAQAMRKGEQGAA